MAKIIYAVAGEGFGHSSRSHIIGQRFIDAGHNVLFVGSRKSLAYLKESFGHKVKEVFGLSFAFKDGRIDKSETLRRNLMKFSEANKVNYELFRKVFEPFGPDLVISDFEPFSAWWAWRKGVPFISIDHEHMLTLCELDHPRRNWFSRLTASVVTEFYYVGAVSYVIVNFFRAPLRIRAAVIAPPVIRRAAEGFEAREGDYILVYSTSANQEERISEIFGKFSDRKFYIYGFGKEGEFGNCVFKKRSTEGFLKDLSGCKGVIASSGFSLISECLHFGKRMLLFPVPGQYEQIINAHYAQKLGLGVVAERIDEDTLGRFLEELDKTIRPDKRILWPDNERFFQVLQGQLEKINGDIRIV